MKIQNVPAEGRSIARDEWPVTQKLHFEVCFDCDSGASHTNRFLRSRASRRRSRAIPHREQNRTRITRNSNPGRLGSPHHPGGCACTRSKGSTALPGELSRRHDRWITTGCGNYCVEDACSYFICIRSEPVRTSGEARSPTSRFGERHQLTCPRLRRH